MKNKNKDNVVHIRAVVPLDEEQIEPKISKVRKYKNVWLFSICIVALVVVIWLISTQITTYTRINIVQSYDDVIVANNSCIAFQDGILRYGKDGVAYMDSEGQEVWNHPYQINNPFVKIAGNSAIIADMGGNYIVVVNAQGMKGEVETFLPIEKAAVSSQGIIAVLVKDSYTPQIICYDAVGNMLVEHKTSLQGTGYPVGIALSLDGTMLLVSYLQVSVEGVATNYVYYNFSGNDFIAENVAASGVREGVIIPEVEFLNENTSVLVSEKCMELFVGQSEPELMCTIDVDKKIHSICYGDDKIGVLLDGDSEGKYELQVYNDTGKLLFSREVMEEYKKVEIVENQIILLGGEKCLIYSARGVEKFDGELDVEAFGVFPVFGINKYVIIGDEGMKKVQLVR